MTPMRYVFLVLMIIVSILYPSNYFLKQLVTQISLHFIVSLSNENYSQAMSIAKLKERLRGNGNTAPHNVPIADEYYLPKNTSRTGRRANAAIVMLGEYLFVLMSVAVPKQFVFSTQFRLEWGCEKCETDGR